MDTLLMTWRQNRNYVRFEDYRYARPGVSLLRPATDGRYISFP